MFEVLLDGMLKYVTKKEFNTLYESNKLNVENDTTGQNDYHTGAYLRYIKYDFYRAIEYYLKSIEKKNGHAMNDLGYYYYTIEKNYELTKKYYIMAIEQKMCKSMYSLGHYYENIENNIEIAKKYYTMGAELNYSEAIEALGDIHNYIENNKNDAIKCYVKAISLGNFNAYKELEQIANQLEIFCIFEKNKIDYNDKMTIKNSKDIQIYKNKIKHISKNDDCPICLNENVHCIPVTCSAHFICTDCYTKIYNKPCPICRL